MKKGNVLTFFPGKGIYTNPDSGLDPVFSVYKKAEAERIFEDLSKIIFYYKKIDKASEIWPLVLAHGRIKLKRKKINRNNNKLTFNFSEQYQSIDTRLSCSNTELNWDKIRYNLKKQGYSLIKRDPTTYIPRLKKDLIHIYAVVHNQLGVIAEGKGFSDNQAMRSALSEAIERCFSSGDQRKDVIVGKQTDLLKEKDINIISGARDTYTKNVYTEWINAIDLLSGDNIYLPAEVAFFNYTPKQLKIRLFSLSHTTGMATGVTFEDAVLSGILEVIERDAYWIMMRCKINCPDIDLRKINCLSDKVLELVTDLNKCGFYLSIKDMSLDWGIPVAHVVLKDKEGKIPCFAHGSGAGLDWAMAVSRAVAEAVQMYLGMKEFASVPDNWEQVISTQGNLGSGVLSWSDPLFEVHMGHLLDKSFSKFNSKLRVKGPIELLNILRKKGYSIIVAPINYIDGLKTVRVYIPEATQPDERLERISCRLIKYKNKLRLKSFYSDPILT